MSQAFMREKEEEWLGDIDPNVNALARYLTRQNNGVKVYEIKSYFHPDLKIEVHEMSDGSTYALDIDKRWYMV